MTTPSWLWIIFVIVAAASQTARNAMQKELTSSLGTVGATLVRFIFGLPFAVLFLAVVCLVQDAAPYLPGPVSLGWTLLGAVAQVIATAFMLAAMRERAFVVATALTKIEPLWVAVLGLILLGDGVSFLLALAIAVATGGVLTLSWPRRATLVAEGWSWRPALLGIASGAMFGVSAIGFRGGIVALEAEDFVRAAGSILVLALFIQTALLATYLIVRDRLTLHAIVVAWRPSVVAGFTGALASQFWFLAFAIETAAHVRTLALIEILFAQIVTRRIFKERIAMREMIGLAAIIVGVMLLLQS